MRTLAEINKWRIVEDISSAWNPARFEMERKPLVVGTVAHDDLDSEKLNVLDMPIKLPYGEITMQPIAGIRNILNKCLDFEKTINRNWFKYYVYITINQGIVKAGETQRRAGAYFDGMQGARYPKKLPVCHSYLVASALPTVFFTHPFIVGGLDENKHNWFTAFDRQKDYSKVFRPQLYEIVLQSAYNVHECPIAEADTQRTFIRIEFSLKKFNRTGNTLNPLIDTSDWRYESRQIPEHLI